MAKESSLEEREQTDSEWPRKPDYVQLQQEAAERGERQKAEKDEYRRARQVRLGHVEAPKKKASTKKTEESKSDSEE